MDGEEGARSDPHPETGVGRVVETPYERVVRHMQTVLQGKEYPGFEPADKVVLRAFLLDFARVCGLSHCYLAAEGSVVRPLRCTSRLPEAFRDLMSRHDLQYFGPLSLLADDLWRFLRDVRRSLVVEEGQERRKKRARPDGDSDEEVGSVPGRRKRGVKSEAMS